MASLTTIYDSQIATTIYRLPALRAMFGSGIRRELFQYTMSNSINYGYVSVDIWV